MLIDYTKFEPGVALAAKIILSTCLKCGKTGHERRTKRHTRFIHSASIGRSWSDAGRSRTTCTAKTECRLTPAQRRKAEAALSVPAAEQGVEAHA